MKLNALFRSILSTLYLTIIVASVGGCRTSSSRSCFDGISFDNIISRIGIKTYNETILFLGNPGTGKSSLLNSIFQKGIFASGISIGTGLTKSKQEYIYEGKKYIDLPGISDIDLQEQAIREVELALKENTDCKVVFVVTLESGRLKREDLANIELVLNAVSVDLEYGIIINKLGNNLIRQFIGDNKLFNSYFSKLKRQPSSIVSISRFEAMEDEDNMCLPADSQDRTALVNFIAGLVSNKILPEQVQAIEDAEEINKRIMVEAEKIQNELREERERQAEYQRQLRLEEKRQKELERERTRLLNKAIQERNERRRIERARRMAALQNQRVEIGVQFQVGCNVM